MVEEDDQIKELMERAKSGEQLSDDELEIWKEHMKKELVSLGGENAGDEFDDALAELSEAGRKFGEGLAKAGIKEKDIRSIGGSGLKNVMDNIVDDDKKRNEKNRMIFFFIILAIIGVILAL
tara:strand:+ start:470 stop:835 length:366 start_codon:yes stop_codon:yes gene_type:complete